MDLGIIGQICAQVGIGYRVVRDSDKPAELMNRLLSTSDVPVLIIYEIKTTGSFSVSEMNQPLARYRYWLVDKPKDKQIETQIECAENCERLFLEFIQLLSFAQSDQIKDGAGVVNYEMETYLEIEPNQHCGVHGFWNMNSAVDYICSE